MENIQEKIDAIIYDTMYNDETIVVGENSPITLKSQSEKIMKIITEELEGITKERMKSFEINMKLNERMDELKHENWELQDENKKLKRMLDSFNPSYTPTSVPNPH